MIHKSHPLVRTNVALSGNVQCIIDEQYKVKFAKLTGFNEIEFSSIGGTYADNAVKVWKQLQMSNELIFAVNKDDMQTQQQITSYDAQYDWQYTFGCKHTKTPNKFRYFAPLYLNKASMPQYFVLFRCDNLTDSDLTIETLMKDATLLCKWDLSKISELTQHQQQMHFAPLYIGQSADQPIRWYGFSIENGKYIEHNGTKIDKSNAEQSIIEFEQLLVDSFGSNKIACSHIVNLSFDFIDNEPGIHRYVGMYVDYETSTKLESNVALADIPFYHYFDNSINLLEYTTAKSKTATVGNDIVKLPTLIDYSRIYSENVVAKFSANDGLKPNIYTKHRSLTFKFTGNMVPGESFTILVNGKEDLKVYCIHKTSNDIADTANWFTRKHTIQETIDAFITAFNYANLNSTYNYSIEQVDAQTLTIQSNCGSNNIQLQVNVAPYSISVGTKPWQPVIDFDAAITTQNSILVTKYLESYLLTVNYLVLYIDGQQPIKTQILQTVNATDIENTIVVLIDNVLPETYNAIAFDMLQIKQATANLCYIYDLYDLSGFYESEQRYMSNTEFDVDAWYTSMIVLTDDARYLDIFKQYKEAAKANNTVNAIKSLQTPTTNLEFSDVEYDKYDDLTEYALENKPNIRQHHWSTINGTDSMNKIARANNSIAFNCTSKMPYEKLASYLLDAFSYSWFVEGFDMPLYIGNLPIEQRNLIAKSYATGQITIEDLQSTTIDCFNDKLLHKFDMSTMTDYVECWTVAYEKPGSTFAYVMFKGVEYILSSNYINYRFAVIHINSDSIFDSVPQFIANHKFKFAAIVLPYQIVDRAVTNIDGILGDDVLYVDKSLLYSTASVFQVKSLGPLVVDSIITIADATKTQWLLNDVNQQTPIIENYDGAPLFGASIQLNSSQFTVTDIITVGNNITLFAHIKNDYTEYDVNIDLIDIVAVSYDMIWFRNAIYHADYGQVTDDFELLADIYEPADNKQDIFNGQNAYANNLATHAALANILLPANTVIGQNRFSPLAYFVQFNKINALNEIQCMQKYLREQLVNAAHDSNAQVYVQLTRYGLFCMPELTKLTKWKLLYDNGNYHLNTILNDAFDMQMYALCKSTDICKATTLSLLSTNQSSIYRNEQFIATADISKFRELGLFAGQCIKPASASTTVGIKNAGMQTNTIDLVSCIIMLFGKTTIEYDSLLKYAEFLLGKYVDLSITYTDSNGSIVQPLTIEHNAQRYIKLTFEQPIGDVYANISFASA